jgi:5,10-methylenetetrahydrofolate reductase
MHVQDIFQSHPTTFSFEFFPPKTAETAESLYETIRELEPYQPHFVSVTYGAGGSTRELTHELVVRIVGNEVLAACTLRHGGVTQRKNFVIRQCHEVSEGR